MYGFPRSTSGASKIVSQNGTGAKTHHVIRRAHNRVCIARIFVANGAINGAALHGGSMNDLIVLDSVELANNEKVE